MRIGGRGEKYFDVTIREMTIIQLSFFCSSLLEFGFFIKLPFSLNGFSYILLPSSVFLQLGHTNHIITFSRCHLSWWLSPQSEALPHLKLLLIITEHNVFFRNRPHLLLPPL